MEASHEDTSGSGTVPEGETGVIEFVEIKIRTPDYTLRVEKNVAVPALKERLVSVVGVPVERQRLTCHGIVLEDDQLLSAYNVEDGHTLHMVARQPPSTSAVGPSAVSSEDGQGETDAPPSGRRHARISHGPVMRVLNFLYSVQGQLADLNRMITTALSAMAPLHGGTGNADSPNGGVSRTPGGLDGGASDGRNGGSNPDTSFGDMEVQIDALYGRPQNSAGTTGQSHVSEILAAVDIPNRLTTMSQNLDRFEQSLDAVELARTRNSQESGNTEVTVASDVCALGDQPQQGALPATFGALVNRIYNLVHGHAGSPQYVARQHLSSRLQREPTTFEAASGDDLQHVVFRNSHLMWIRGFLLVELGRATLSFSLSLSHRLARQLQIEPTNFEAGSPDDLLLVALYTHVDLLRNSGAQLWELGTVMLQSARIHQSQQSASLVNWEQIVFLSALVPNPMMDPSHSGPEQPLAAETVERPAEGEVKATENAQSSRDSLDGHSVERALDLGVTSMAVDEVSGDPERSEATENAQSSRDSLDGHSVERALDLGVTSMAVDEVSGDPERSEATENARAV